MGSALEPKKGHRADPHGGDAPNRHSRALVIPAKPVLREGGGAGIQRAGSGGNPWPATEEGRIASERFRELLLAALEDPAVARAVASRLLLPGFPVRGAACTAADLISHGNFGFSCGPDTGNYYFAEGGSVGIGTTSTTEARLTVDAGSGATSGLILGSVSATAGNFFDFSAGTGDLIDSPNVLGHLRFTVDSTGPLKSSLLIYVNTGSSALAALKINNLGKVGVGTLDRLSGLTVKAKASFTATGTVTTSGSTVTGTSTLFTKEVAVGDEITVDGVNAETKYVASITDDTHLTVDSNFLNTHSTVTMTVKPSMLRVDDSTSSAPSNIKALVTDQGSLWLGNRLGFLGTGSSSSITAATEIYRDTNDLTILRNFTQVYSILKVWAKPGAVVNDREATLTLSRGDNDEEIMDVYNNGYSTETQYGIRIAKNTGGQFRDFVFDQLDKTQTPNVKTTLMILKVNGNVGIANGSPNFVLHTSGAAVALGAPSSAPTDANLNSSNISFWLDESGNNLKVRVKYSNGTTLKTATIALV